MSDVFEVMENAFVTQRIQVDNARIFVTDTVTFQWNRRTASSPSGATAIPFFTSMLVRMYGCGLQKGYT